MNNKFIIEEIPFHQIEKLGINQQQLEESGELEKLLKGERTNVLTNLVTVQNGIEKKFSAHLRLEKNTDGKLRFKVEAPLLKDTIQMAKPEDISLDKIPFHQLDKFGITQASLQASGDLDRLLRGEKTDIIKDIPFFISGIQKKASARLFLISTLSKTLKFQMDFSKPTSPSKEA